LQAVMIKRATPGADKRRVGVENREWYAQPPKRQRSAARRSGLALLAVVVAGLVLAGVARWLTPVRPAFYGGTQRTHAGDTHISILPGLPGITIHGDGLYASNDPWRAYLAPERTCPGGERLDLPLALQAQVMACLVDYARHVRGLGPLRPVTLLNGSAALKAGKITRCSDFNHNACGEDAAADVRGAGYSGAWGENLFIAEGKWGAPRPALDGWLNSPSHRENLFDPQWRTEGIAVTKQAKFRGGHDVTVWAHQLATG
jgi:uncharacterized protein YkwD